MYYNVTLRSICVTTVAVEKQEVLHILRVCVCSLMYPVRRAHAPYHLWPAPLYKIFPHHLINGTFFEKKKLLNTKHVFRISLQLLSKAFLILRRNERDIIENVYFVLHVKYPSF
jgi:hypothetical protein